MRHGNEDATWDLEDWPGEGRLEAGMGGGLVERGIGGGLDPIVESVCDAGSGGLVEIGATLRTGGGGNRLGTIVASLELLLEPSWTATVALRVGSGGVARGAGKLFTRFGGNGVFVVFLSGN